MAAMSESFRLFPESSLKPTRNILATRTLTHPPLIPQTILHSSKQLQTPSKTLSIIKQPLASSSTPQQNKKVNLIDENYNDSWGKWGHSKLMILNFN
jgi:hypothetical protein